MPREVERKKVGLRKRVSVHSTPSVNWLPALQKMPVSFAGLGVFCMDDEVACGDLPASYAAAFARELSAVARVD